MCATLMASHVAQADGIAEDEQSKGDDTDDATIELKAERRAKIAPNERSGHDVGQDGEMMVEEIGAKPEKRSFHTGKFD